MNRYQVFITPFAAENIREAFKWYQLENPIYAAKWKSGLEDAIQALGTFPYSHALAPENEEFEEEVRQLLYGKSIPWRVLYTVLGSKVYVLHVRHGQRDYWRPQRQLCLSLTRIDSQKGFFLTMASGLKT